MILELCEVGLYVFTCDGIGHEISMDHFGFPCRTDKEVETQSHVVNEQERICKEAEFLLGLVSLFTTATYMSLFHCEYLFVPLVNISARLTVL